MIKLDTTEKYFYWQKLYFNLLEFIILSKTMYLYRTSCVKYLAIIFIRQIYFNLKHSLISTQYHMSQKRKKLKRRAPSNYTGRLSASSNIYYSADYYRL